MKRSLKIRVFWIVVSIIMIAGMLIFTIYPLITARGI